MSGAGHYTATPDFDPVARMGLIERDTAMIVDGQNRVRVRELLARIDGRQIAGERGAHIWIKPDDATGGRIEPPAAGRSGEDGGFSYFLGLAQAGFGESSTIKIGKRRVGFGHCRRAALVGQTGADECAGAGKHSVHTAGNPST